MRLRNRTLPPKTARRLGTPRQMMITGAVGLGLAALLNAGAMERSADGSSYGLRRTVSLAVLHPLSRVSSALGLDRPRAALDALTGHGGSPHESGSGGDTVLASGPAPSFSSRHAPELVSTGEQGQIDEVPTPDPDQPPAIRISRHIPAHYLRPAWTAEQPLRLWVGGDSVSGFLTIELVNMAGDTGVINAHGHYKISTGLSRPDYYDWPAHLAEDMAQYDPEVVIFMLGANDDQPLSVGGNVYSFGSDQWRAEYARRVGQVMDMLVNQHRLVFWVGQPVMRSPDFNDRMSVMNNIYQAQAATRPDVTFIDSRPTLADGSGAYADYLPDGGGLTLMRAPDGIHLTPAGGARLARAVLDAVRQRWAEVEAPISFGSSRTS
jgi:uncharacterized protein